MKKSIKLSFKKMGSKIFLGLIILSFFSIPINSIAWEKPDYVEAVVLLEEGVNCDDLEGVEILECCKSINLFRGRMSFSTFNMLKNSPYVNKITEYTEEKGILLNDVLPDGVDDINAELVWGGTEDDEDVTPGRPSGEGVKVAVIDSGIKTNHEDLAQNYAGGYDFKDNDNNPMETVNVHGTICAGVIAAVDNDIWPSGIGVAPKVSLYALRTSLDQWQVAQAIDWCISHDIDVISISLAFHPLNPVNWVIEEALFRAFICNVIVVAGAGNYPQCNIEDWVWYPACSGWTLAVGAYDPSHRERGRIDASDYGEYSFSSCYGLQLGLLAPGWQCKTTDFSSDNYGLWSGTSVAAPHVAGVCALMRAVNPTISVSDVYGFIESTADDIGPSGWDIETGYGIVNAYEAVVLADAIPPVVDIIAPSYNYQTVKDSFEIKATASDNIGISSVKVKIDNGAWYDCVASSDYWSWTWDTTTASEGNHLITCKAYDVSGNTHQDQIYAYVHNILSGGSGECPNLLVWDGNEFIDEGVLPIHNEENSDQDMTLYHHLDTTPQVSQNNLINLKLAEIGFGYEFSQSFTNQVKLYALNTKDEWVGCPLISAIHTRSGNVKRDLRFEDTRRVETLKGDEINLFFLVMPGGPYKAYKFMIIGHNKFKF